MNGRDADAKAMKLLEQWRNEPIDGALLGVHDQRQLQNVAQALRGVARARSRRQRWRRLSGALAVAATVLGLAVGGWYVSRGPAQPVAQATHAPEGVELAASEGEVRALGAAGQPLERGAQLTLGASVETGDGSASLVFASGARASVGASTSLGVEAAGLERREALSLARGTVDVEVPKLAQPVEFSVRTPDATVVVHGTRFAVRVDPDARGGQLTHVIVTRGLVSVLSRGQQSWVRAGEEWPAAAPPALLDPEPDPATPEAAKIEQTLRRAARVSAQRAYRARRSLAAENRMFAAAMAKHKAGDLSGALQEIDRLIRQYPDTLLLQEARVERFRLLRRLGRRAEAAKEARSYLGDYHDGYARDEARGLALEKP
jgi:hypothetical protein